MFLLLSIFWLIRETRAILFWLYLWQLKEYHIGRFLAHFSTEKGKKLFFNWLFIFKIFLFLYVLSTGFYSKLFFSFGTYNWIILILIILYFFESAKFLLSFFKKQIKRPVLTKKSITLISANLSFVVFFLFFLYKITSPFFYWLELALGLLFFDIFSPLLISLIVLLFQPITILLRNRIIKKAKLKREKFRDLLVIGITGSYGKTSTKEFLATILAEKFGENKVLKTKKHQNSEVGISQTILNDLKPEHQIFICEMGAYNRGGIKLLCDIVKPKIGILTGINEQHMATYGSQDNIIHTKFELIQALPEDGLAILNDSDPKIKNEKLKMKNYNSKLKNIKFYSIDEKKDIWAKDIKVEKEFISFKAVAKDGDSADFKLNLLGEHNVLNILGAAVAAKELGMNLKEISAACQKIKPEQSGFQLKKGVAGLNIIDATYSANPDGVISHLEYLKLWQGKKVIAMPCLIELGNASKDVHKRLGRKIGEVCAPVKEPNGSNWTPSGLAIITTKDKFKELKEGFIEGGGKEESILFYDNPEKIFEKIKTFCKEDDVVFLESRVPAELIIELVKK